MASARFLQLFLTRFLSLSYVRVQIRRYCLSIGLTALLYFLVAKLIFAGLKLGIEPSPVWPPAGIGLFVLLSQGRQAWLGVTLGILLMGVWLGVGWQLALGSALGGTLEALIGVTLLRRVGFRNEMERLSDVLSFIGLAGLAAPLLNATISTGTNLAVGQIPQAQIGQTWWTFWLGDSMGILVFTPLLLSGCRQLRRRRQSLASLWQSQLPEKLLCFSLLLSISALVFWLRPSEILVNYPIEYLPLPFVIWAALRFGQTAGILASFTLSMVAITGTVAGNGPFATMTHQLPQQSRQVILLQQAFLGVVTMTTLILATLVSERRRVGELLRQSQASLAKAQQLAQLGNWDFDFQQRQWNWSDQLYRLLELPVQETQPELSRFLAAVHPADRDQVEQAMQRALTQRLPYRINYRLSLPNGRQRIVEDQVAIGITHATGTILDITEFKQTEEQLRLNAERNRLLSEIALRIRQSLELDEILDRAVQEVRQFLRADRVLICRFDAAGQGQVIAEAVQPEWPSALSMTSEADVYAEIEAMFANAPICVVNDTALQERTPFIRQYHDRYQVRAGMGVALLSAATGAGADGGAVKSAEPQLFGLLICHQCSRPRQWQPLEIDLLEQLGTQVAIAIQQGQLYQQVQHLNESLERQVVERTAQLGTNLAKLGEMNQLQAVFLHAIAHDLRTTVMGSQLVLNHFQQQQGEQVLIPRSKLELMAQSGQIQLCKLDSLLEAYRNKTEGVTLEPQPTQLLPLIQAAVAQLKPLFEQNQTDLRLEMPVLPPVNADPTQLERVLKHLLVNAVKHNPPGIQVTIQAEAAADHLRCTIADQGRGLSEAEQLRLFDLKTTEGAHRQLTGISVGLCLCHQIVAAHGGQIGVDTVLGVGSRFWFTLPLAPRSEAVQTDLCQSAD